MTLEDYNEFCASLPHAAHVVQWGGAHVWKVGGLEKGKVFAIGMWPDSDGRSPSPSNAPRLFMKCCATPKAVAPRPISPAEG